MPISSEKYAALYTSLAKDYFADCVVRNHPIVFHLGAFWEYNGTRYDRVAKMAMDVRRWFHTRSKSQNNSLIGEMVKVLEYLAFRDDKTFPTMPFYIGAVDYPDPIDAVAFKNGILDLRAFRRGQTILLPHTSDWVSPYCSDFDFDENAKCERWIAFLNDIFSGDPQRIGMLQEWFGYCLTADNRYHAAMWLYGLPRAGKGTVSAALQAIIGKHLTTAFSLHSLANDFGVRRLEGKLLALVGEVHLTNKSDKQRILGTMNSIIGGDPQPIEKKGLNDSYDAMLPTRFMLSCNELPQWVDPSGAQAARALLLKFDKSYVGREDRELINKLLKDREGIAAWALEGYKRLHANGRFASPEVAERIHNQFRRESSDTFAFLQDCLVINKRFDTGNLAGLSVTADEVSVEGNPLQIVYRQWCEANGKEYHYNWLMRDMRAYLDGFTQRRIWRKNQYGVSEQVYIYDGIGLKL